MDGSRKDQIEDIRLKSDIVETVGRYVPLKKAGNRFKACCPFHKERTPSFHVDPDKQLFHCFGCGAGGDVFSFVMQYERVEFMEAARILAERAGIQFERQERTESGPKQDKAALYHLHEQLASFYHETLKNDPSAQSARDYLSERTLDDAINEFQLGFAPPQLNQLTQWAEKQHVARAQLELAGVLLPSDRGGPPYDRFKGRLMFPIRDEQGRVVGFSGRILDQSSRAKYVNSPETLLFKKSRLLYGLDRARQPMVDSRRALICEGQIDVIRCHLAGYTTAVAPQGTALTEAHALLLKRYADEVILLFDADTAGQTAALRGAEALLQAGLTVRIAALPKDSDPDTLISEQGAGVFEQYIEEALSLIAFHVRVLKERDDIESAAGKLRAAKALLETIQHAASAVQRESFLSEAADLLDTPIDALREDMRKIIRPSARSARTEEQPPPPAPQTSGSYPPDELGLIELMIAHPEVLDLVNQFVPPEAIRDDTCRQIIEAIMALPELEGGQLMQALDDKPEACRRLAATTQMTARTIASDEVSCVNAAQDIILRLRIRLLEQEIKDNMKKLSEAAPADRRLLNNETAHLMMLKKKLQQGWATALPIFELEA